MSGEAKGRAQAAADSSFATAQKIELDANGNGPADTSTLDEFRLPAIPGSGKAEKRTELAGKDVDMAKSTAEVRKYLQSEIINWLEASPEAGKVKEEAERGVFGPETKKAYKDFAEKYINKELNAGILGSILQTMKLNEKLLPGAPFEANPQSGLETQREPSFEIWNKLASGKIALTSKLDPERLPDLAGMQTVIDAAQWKQMQDRRNLASSLETYKQHLSKKILESNGKYPLSWQYKEGEDKLGWALSVNAAMETRDQLASRIDYWHYATKMGYQGAPPPPPGVELVKDKNGDLTEIKIALPERPYLSEPRFQSLLKVYEDWLSLASQDLQKSAELLNLTVANPLDGIRQGYSPIPATASGVSSKAVFSADKKFMYLAGGQGTQSQLKAGETLKEVNLVYHDTKVTNFPDGSIQLTLTKQAMNKEFILGRDWMASKVGEPKVIISPRLRPETPVVVSNGTELATMRAEHLESWVESRKAADAFWETTAGVLDLSMIALGGIELFALKGGRMALAAALGEAGSAVVSRTALLGGLDRGAKLTAGGLWALDNSRARQHAFVEGALKAKTAYITFDLSKGLFLSLKGLSDRSIAFNKGIHDLLSEKLLLMQVQKAGRLGFRATELPMVATSLYDSKVLSETLQNPMKKFDAEMALAALKEGKRVTAEKDLPPKPTEQAKKDLDLAARMEKIEELQILLLESCRQPKEAAQVKAVFAALKELFSGQVPESGKEKLFKEWGVSFTIPNAFDLARLEESNNGPLSQSQRDDIFDPAKRAFLKPQLKTELEKLLARRSESLANAHAIALFLASAGNGEKLPQTFGQHALEVPAYRISKVYELNKGEQSKQVYLPGWQAPRAVVDELASKRVLKQIESLMAKPASPKAAILAGELLLYAGTIDHRQYGQTLLSILENPEVSKTDKLSSLSDRNGLRLAEIYPFLLAKENMPKEKGAGKDTAAEADFGGRARDFESVLMRVASSESDPDLRAMAQAILYGSRRSIIAAESGLAIIGKASQAKEKSVKASEGELARSLNLAFELQGDLSSAPSMQSLQAADFLLSMGGNLEIKPAEILAALKANLSSKNREQAELAISLLNQNLLQSASAPDKEMIGEAIFSLLSNKSAADKQELRQAALVLKVPEIFQSLEERSQTKIEELLSKILSDHESYGESVDMRLAVLEAVKNTGKADSFKKEILSLAGESRFPEIRANAYALLSEKDYPELAEFLKQRSKLEKDPLLADLISDKLEFEKLKLAPESEIAAIWNNYAYAIDHSISEKTLYPLLRSFNWQAQASFLSEEVFLLDYHTFKDEAGKNAQNSWWFLDRLIGDPNKQERDSVRFTSEQREKHWQRLKELALSNNAEKAIRARYMFYQIASSNGVPVSRSDGKDTINTGRQKIEFESPRSLWEMRAVDALCQALKPGTPHRDFSIHLLRMALSESNPWSTPLVRRKLLEAWQEQYDNKSLSKREYLLVLAAARRAESQKVRRDYQLELELDAKLGSYPSLKSWSHAGSRERFFWINLRN